MPRNDSLKRTYTIDISCENYILKLIHIKLVGIKEMQSWMEEQ